MSKNTQPKYVPADNKVAVGIDVAQDTLAVHILPAGTHFETTNDLAGHRLIIDRIKPFNPYLVVMEGTGGLETCLAVALNESGFPVAIVNPRQVRSFAKGLNFLAKTDAIDAYVLAVFAQLVPIQPRMIPDEQQLLLKELTKRRLQLVEMREGEKNHLRRVTAQTTTASIISMLAHIESEIESIEKKLKDIIRSSPIYRENDELFQSVKGIADKTSFVLLALLPELGTLNRREIAALAGLAPFNKDSGKSSEHRCISGGRSAVRKALYMAVLSAIRCNPAIKSYYEHLRNENKLFKVAIVACMRKLLTILNAMMKQKYASSKIIVAVNY